MANLFHYVIFTDFPVNFGRHNALEKRTKLMCQISLVLPEFPMRYLKFPPVFKADTGIFVKSGKAKNGLIYW